MFKGDENLCKVPYIHVEFHALPAEGSSSNGGSCREDVGDDGFSGGLLVALPRPPSLGPDRALLWSGLAEADVDAGLPLMEWVELEVLEDKVGVEILAELQI